VLAQGVHVRHAGRIDLVAVQGRVVGGLEYPRMMPRVLGIDLRLPVLVRKLKQVDTMK
jgi:hypothetical protein